jgi:hypothetical protein
MGDPIPVPGDSDLRRQYRVVENNKIVWRIYDLPLRYAERRFCASRPRMIFRAGRDNFIKRCALQLHLFTLSGWRLLIGLTPDRRSANERAGCLRCRSL